MITYDSPVNISLPNVPEEIEDEILFRELLAIHDAIEALVTYASGRTRFRGKWKADTVYFHADQVLDDGWLMWAIEKNEEKAAPTPIGTPDWVLDETDPGWVVSSPTGSAVQTGVDFEVIEAGYVSGLSVYIPDLALFKRTTSFDVDDEDNVGKFIFEIESVGLVEIH